MFIAYIPRWGTETPWKLLAGDHTYIDEGMLKLGTHLTDVWGMHCFDAKIEPLSVLETYGDSCTVLCCDGCVRVLKPQTDGTTLEKHIYHPPNLQ